LRHTWKASGNLLQGDGAFAEFVEKVSALMHNERRHTLRQPGNAPADLSRAGCRHPKPADRIAFDINH